MFDTALGEYSKNMKKVKRKTQGKPTVTPADLRAYMARHSVPYSEIAARRGCSQRAVNAALRADLTGRPVSQSLLHNILDHANVILLEREQAGLLAG